MEETRDSLLMQIDKLTSQQSIMQSDHTYIHAGISFSVALSLGSISAAYHIAFETPGPGTYVHYRPSSSVVSTDANAVQFMMREGIASFTGGTEITPFNRNRNNSNAAEVVVTNGVTPTIGSPVIIDIFSVGSTGFVFSSSGGSGGSGEEIILKPSTTYLFTFTPGGATNATFKNLWYEETIT